MAQKQKNQKKQKKPNKNQKLLRRKSLRRIRLDVGNVIFIVLFFYIVFVAISCLGKERVQFYEVAEGSIVNNKQYTGLILREEQVRNTEQGGYINYYLQEGKRASVGTRIYTLDETGRLKEVLKAANESGSNLSKENLTDLRKQLTAYILGFKEDDFSSIYNTKYSLEASMLEYSSFNDIDQLERLAREADAVVQQAAADVSGVISYGFDSFEGMTPEEVDMSCFDKGAYTRTMNKSGAEIAAGAPAYKIVTSESWSIIFPLSEEDRAAYGDKTSLQIRLLDYNRKLNAAYSSFTGKDGTSFGRLDLNKYMAQFITDRYINFEIEQPQAQGLKIPISAVTEKNFFMIPKNYLVQGGDSSDSGFNKETYDANGTSVVFVPTELYSEDKEFCYIEADEDGEFKAGDVIVRPESSDRYQIGRTSSLKGVYNINKGYTVFKQIEILDSNSEYYTIKKGLNYGLSVYDHIVLDASTVGDDQLLYK